VHAPFYSRFAVRSAGLQTRALAAARYVFSVKHAASIDRMEQAPGFHFGSPSLVRQRRNSLIAWATPWELMHFEEPVPQARDDLLP